jgi:transposase
MIFNLIDRNKRLPLYKKEAALKSYNITMKDINRYEIIKRWLDRMIDGNQASLLLGVSRRHALRLKKAFKERGIEGLIPKKRGGRKSIPESLKEKITRLFNGKHGGRFNILHFNEKLEEIENIHLSYNSIRRILIDKGLHKPKERKKDHITTEERETNIEHSKAKIL